MAGQSLGVPGTRRGLDPVGADMAWSAGFSRHARRPPHRENWRAAPVVTLRAQMACRFGTQLPAFTGPAGASYPHSESLWASAIRIRGACGRQLSAFGESVGVSYPHSGSRWASAIRIRGAGAHELPARGEPMRDSSPHSQGRRATVARIKRENDPARRRRGRCGAPRVPAEAGVPSRRGHHGRWPTDPVSRAAFRSTDARRTGTPGRRCRASTAGTPPPVAPGPGSRSRRRRRRRS